MSTNSQSQVTAARQRAVQYIKSHCQNGAWSYVGDGMPSLEATAWSAIALRGDRDTVPAAIDFLGQNQNPDGGWSSAPGTGTSDWTTAPVILALRILSREEAAKSFNAKLGKCLNRAFEFLFDTRVDVNQPVTRLLIMAVQGPRALDYPRGWPWNPGTYQWVEPTSYCLLALKIPQLPEKQIFKELVEHANDLLIKHACAKGGWNYGANVTLGVNLPPFVVTTAEALLALQDVEENLQIRAGMAYLQGKHETKETAMSLAWTILAKDAHNLNCDKELSELAEMQKTDGGIGPNMMVTSLATVALGVMEGVNPLKISQKLKLPGYNELVDRLDET